jgi:hypothetical protein
MTLLNLFSSRARVGNGDTPSDDRSIILMVVLLLGLVFAPVIGLHIAVTAFGPQTAASTPDSLAHHVTLPAKSTRG